MAVLVQQGLEALGVASHGESDSAQQLRCWMEIVPVIDTEGLEALPDALPDRRVRLLLGLRLQKHALVRPAQLADRPRRPPKHQRLVGFGCEQILQGRQGQRIPHDP